ncbi:MAG: putative bifunctional diguanylate cyclase/phosphodiesterase [Streptosporangiaceae bacterium]
MLWASPATVAALVCAALAAVVVIVVALAGALVGPAGLAAIVSVSLLLLVLRLVALGAQATSVAAAARESERRFRALARATSDVVIVTSLTGDVEYVSPAIADFGFTSGEVIGTRLIDLVHPEDRLAALRGAVRGLRAGRAETFAGRARSADGSWRHVESTVSRYSADGEQARLLITVSDVSDRVALRRQVTHLTYHDGLTGLPNRAYLEDLVKDVQETGARDAVTGVVLVDLDGYTAVNDLLGHSGGDVLLAQAGRRLRAAAPVSATVARWGADEFAILITDAAAGGEVTAAAEALADHIRAEPFAIGAKEIPLTASVGVATSDGADGDQLLGNAHVALSRAKEAGGSRVEVFAAEMHAEALRRLELASDLHLALAEHRLAIEYRPIADLRTSAVVAAEAVVCWSHGGSLVPAADLLEAASDAGIVAQIGDWLLADASSQVASRRADGEQIDLWISCSARQLTRPDAVALIRSALAESGLPPCALTLQVAEGLLMDDGDDSVLTALAGLRETGIRLAIGDFGTGYASLANLGKIPVDAIKIAPMFVSGLGADSRLAAVTRTIINLGRTLGIDVVADGIERPAQRDDLVAMGCGLGQGPAVRWPVGTYRMRGPAGGARPALPTRSATEPTDR